MDGCTYPTNSSFDPHTDCLVSLVSDEVVGQTYVVQSREVHLKHPRAYVISMSPVEEKEGVRERSPL